MTKWISFGVCILVLIGFYHRKDKKKHVPLMAVCFLTDIALLIYIEWTRKAVNTALHPHHPFVIFHVLISSLVLLAYFSQGISGWFSLQRDRSLFLHRWGGYLFILLRFVNFATSLWVERFVRNSSL